MATNRSVTPSRASDVTRWDEEADVVIVGYGIAGVAAGIAAAEAGADVLMLERAGGSEGTCGGILYLGGGTPMQASMGVKDTVEDMQNFLRAALGPGVDEAKLQAYCRGSVDHYNWLKACGVALITGPDPEGTPLATPDEDGCFQVGGQEYAGGGLVWTGGENAAPFDTVARPAPRGHIPRDPTSDEDLFEGAVVKSMFGAAARAGARLRVDTGIERLIVDQDGRVVGVEGRTFGESVRIRARRGVVVTTGGFIYNDAMLDAYNSHLSNTAKLGHSGQDGLGIRMCQAVGADVAHMDASDVTLMCYPPISFAKGLLVNQRGERFINEDTYYGRLGARAKFQQGGVSYLLLDQNIFVESSWRRPTWVAETLGELEEEMGLPVGSLERTVEYYNRSAIKGEDPMFHKQARWVQPLEPPFAVIDLAEAGSEPSAVEDDLRESSGVALAIFTLGAFTLGGLRTDADGAVLNVSGEPIAGLYAAGRVTSGLAVYGYCSGISLGDGTFFGRRAGSAAANN